MRPFPVGSKVTWCGSSPAVVIDYYGGYPRIAFRGYGNTAACDASVLTPGWPGEGDKAAAVVTVEFDGFTVACRLCGQQLADDQSTTFDEKTIYQMAKAHHSAEHQEVE